MQNLVVEDCRPSVPAREVVTALTSQYLPWRLKRQWMDIGAQERGERQGWRFRDRRHGGH